MILSRRCLLFSLIGLALAVVLALYFTKDHWWLVKGSVSVYIDGVRSENSRVYRSTKERLLAEVQVGNLTGYFVIHVEEGEITIPNGSEFLRLPYCRYAWGEGPLAAPYRKTGRDPILIIREDFIHFMFLDKHVIISPGR